MDSPENGDTWMPTFYIGQHESKRAVLPVTDRALLQAHDCNYDMLTSPITTPSFQQRVLETVRESLNASARHPSPGSATTVPPLSLPDTTISPGGISSSLLAFTSPWIDLCSPDPLVADISRQVLILEVAFAVFCGVEYLFIPGPKLYHGDARTHGIPLYARAIQEVLATGSHCQIHIMLPMVDDPGEEEDAEHDNLMSLAREEFFDDIEELRPQKADIYGTWDAWNMIRTVCKYSTRLSVALSLPQKVPPLSIQSRWFSEPVKLISLTADTFVKNPRGNPVLFEPLRSFISRLMRMKVTPWILLCDVGPIPGFESTKENVPLSNGNLSPDATADASASPTPAEAAGYSQNRKQKAKDPTPYLNYIRYLQRNQPPRSVVEQYCSGYQDHLQFPLQPLTDNLENMTYEVFEKDPVKYDSYEEAIRRALRDWADEGKPASGPKGKVVVTIAGAGRGPLVTRAIRASEATGVPIDLWALEKNPNAYVLLQRHNVEDWDNRVTIVQSDMRSWKGPQHPPSETSREPSRIHTPIDILVSELLGSFADNELSPECLDGVLHLLNPTHGISIPRSYTAFLTPLAAPKLHAEISTRAAWDPMAHDAPSVVWLHATDYLSLAPQTPGASPAGDGEARGVELISLDKGKANAHSSQQPVHPPNAPMPLVLSTWSFHHGPQSFPPLLPNPNTHNKRHCQLSFRTRYRGVCHGLGGYFESVLYPGVELSTNPNTMASKSEGMISWFPMFFPLRTPLYIPDHSLLTVHMWRQTDGRKVWYEWVVESWGYNLMIGGEKKLVRLGGGEVGSSIKGGCLM